MIVPKTVKPTPHRVRDGFTIVELLIVIVVIAILAAISMTAYNGIQDRARATALITGFKKIDKGFRMMAIEQNKTTWWTDASTSLTGSANPLISDIITNTALKNYLQSAPDVSGIPTGFWWYDHDSDVYDPAECAGSTAGVNIAFSNASQKNALEVDKALDDGNLLCGRVRLNVSGGVNRIFYSLSNSQEME